MRMATDAMQLQHRQLGEVRDNRSRFTVRGTEPTAVEEELRLRLAVEEGAQRGPHEQPRRFRVLDGPLDPVLRAELEEAQGDVRTPTSCSDGRGLTRTSPCHRPRGTRRAEVDVPDPARAEPPPHAPLHSGVQQVGPVSKLDVEGHDDAETSRREGASPARAAGEDLQGCAGRRRTAVSRGCTRPPGGPPRREIRRLTVRRRGGCGPWPTAAAAQTRPRGRSRAAISPRGPPRSHTISRQPWAVTTQRRRKEPRRRPGTELTSSARTAAVASEKYIKRWTPNNTRMPNGSRPK